jgi:hypothetical protein
VPAPQQPPSKPCPAQPHPCPCPPPQRPPALQEARAVVSERRGAALQHITTAQEKTGVFGWPDGTPEAGEDTGEGR